MPRSHDGGSEKWPDDENVLLEVALFPLAVLLDLPDNDDFVDATATFALDTPSIGTTPALTSDDGASASSVVPAGRLPEAFEEVVLADAADVVVDEADAAAVAGGLASLPPFLLGGRERDESLNRWIHPAAEADDDD